MTAFHFEKRYCIFSFYGRNYVIFVDVMIFLSNGFVWETSKIESWIIPWKNILKEKYDEIKI